MDCNSEQNDKIRVVQNTIVPQGINCQKLNRSYAAQEANLHVATISILPLFYHALSQKKNCHVW